jgi:hypothetical protein
MKHSPPFGRAIAIAASPVWRMTSIARHTLLEMLGVFMQHQMTLVAHRPPFDEETDRLGRKRFRRLLEVVEKRLARGSIAKQTKKPN